MARIRYIKPEFFEDQRIGELSPRARLLFIGMWTLMDRNGLLEATPAVLRARLFPFDDLRTKDVAALLDEVIRTGRVKLVSIKEQSLLYCPTLRRHQHFHRDERPKYALSQDELKALDEHHADMVLAPFNAIASTPENGERRTENQNGEHTTRHRAKPGFDFGAFWEKYPRKVAKSDAQARFGVLIRSQEDFDSLIEALSRFRAHHESAGTEARFIPHPATFLGTKEIPRWRDWLDASNGKSDIVPASEFVGLKLPEARQ